MNDSAVATASFTINVAPPPGSDMNLALTSTLGAASPCFSGECWDKLIDGDLSGWDGTVSAEAGGTPSVVLDLPGTTLYALSNVRLLTDTGVGFSERWVTQFRVQVSPDGASYQTVLTGQKTTGAFEDFALPAGTKARYVKLLVHFSIFISPFVPHPTTAPMAA